MSPYRRKKLNARARRDAYLSVGIDPDQERAMVFIALLLALTPVMKLLLVMVVGETGNKFRDTWLEVLAAILSLAVTYGIVWSYRRWKAHLSLIEEGKGKPSLDSDDRAELVRLLSAHPGLHVEIGMTDISREVLALDLKEQFVTAKWNVGEMNHTERVEHREGIWICGQDEINTRRIIANAFDEIFLPYKKDSRKFPGIRVFVGRVPS